MPLEIDTTLDVVTDSSALAIFDPVALRSHSGDSDDWFVSQKRARPEIEQGRMVLVSTPMDGEYRVRVTSGALRPEERSAVLGHDDSFFVVVTGARLRVGALENLPGATDAKEHTAEQTILVPNGRYRLDLYAVNAPHSPPSDLANMVARLVPLGESEQLVQPGGRPKLWPERRTKGTRKRRAKPRARTGEAIAPGCPVEFDCEMNTEMIGLFDPAELADAARRPPEWAMDEAAVLAEAQSGRLALAFSSAASMRVAHVVIQMDPLTIEQAKRVVATAPACWLRVTSTNVCCAPSEEWPATTTPQVGPAGRTFVIENDAYSVTFYFLNPQQGRFPIVAMLVPLGNRPGDAPDRIVDALPVGYERMLKKPR